MTIIYAGQAYPGKVRRPVREPYRTGAGHRPFPSRPAGAQVSYRGTGIAVSRATHPSRPRTVRLATTVALAISAGLITLWLGLIAHFGAMANEDSGSTARMPDRLAVVRVEPGETLQDLAARVAPSAPARQVAERIRVLNDLGAASPAAGQTLIAPVG